MGKNMLKQCFSFIVFFIGGMISTGCHSGVPVKQETPVSGTIRISVDESFKPVIDSELKVFESSFPNAHILVEYKPEAACIRDLYSDSTRLVIITRGLTLPEERYFRDSAGMPAVSGILAFDAVALVVHNYSADTLMTMDDVRTLLGGKDKKKQEAVMDGVSATSTVRYVLDSVLRGETLGKNVIAARSSPQVISYVMKKVKVVAIKCDRCPDKPFVYPLPANIVLNKYPMVRGLYYILKENYSGIGNNFVNFLQYERGQLIFQKAYLVPARMRFEIRDVQIQQ
jgi:PBP superfamily domain